MATFPEASLTESARTLVEAARTGTLSTVLRKHPGWPFGSVMPYAPDEKGRPVFLLSRLAVHTRNLAEDRRASLLVVQPDAAGDPLNTARATLIGEVAPLASGDRAAARQAYLARHPASAEWVEFGDFAFYRMTVLEVYYVGGFGVMGWIGAEEYSAFRPRP